MHHTRIENLRTKEKYDVICSRAVSSLENLLSYTIDFSNPNTRFIFLKGKKVDREIIFSKKKWSYNLKCKTSITNKEGKILIIKDLKKKIIFFYYKYL